MAWSVQALQVPASSPGLCSLDLATITRNWPGPASGCTGTSMERVLWSLGNSLKSLGPFTLTVCGTASLKACFTDGWKVCPEG